ncbi:MAG: recombinase family protein [Planctomycetota bacterium]
MSTDGTTKRVGIWIRVSTDEQAHGDSPEHHEHRARCYAEAKGWKIVTVYRLEGVSGKDVAGHPETDRLLADIATGDITGLIFSKLARLARSTKQLLEFADRFKAADADLISLQESIDTSTPAGRFFFTLLAAMAEWEREEIADRVAASVPIRAKLGKPLGGKAPYGYEWRDKKLIPSKAEASIRRRVHELYLEHRRNRTVARLLNEAGYLTRTGKPFSGTTIRRLIADPTAKGLHRANYTTARGGEGMELKPESEWVYSEVEPVVSVELWDACKAIQDEQTRIRKRPAKKTTHLFAGHLYCYCGPKMYVPSKSRKYTCPACRNKIPTDDMEYVFVEKLKGFLLSPEDVEAYLAEANAHLKESEATVASRQSELAKITGQLNRLFELYEAGEIPKAGFGKRYEPLEARRSELERELAEAEATVDVLKVNSLTSDHIMTEGKSLADRWPKLNFAEKRQIIEDVLQEATIGEESVSLKLHYFPSHSLKSVTKRRHKSRRYSARNAQTLSRNGIAAAPRPEDTAHPLKLSASRSTHRVPPPTAPCFRDA